MMKSVKNKSDQANMDIVNYMRKKTKFKDSIEAAQPATPAAAGEGARQGTQPPQGSVNSSYNSIKSFLDSKGVTQTGKGFKMGNKTICMSYEDLLYDLTHNPTRTGGNLTSGETERALKFFKSICMPRSFIQNQKLCAQYINIGNFGSPSSLVETPSSAQQQPVLTTPSRGRGGEYRPICLRDRSWWNNHCESDPYEI